MSDDKKSGADGDHGDPLQKLFEGDGAGFAAAMQERVRGPAGAHIRLAHLTEFVANRLFAGDFVKARRLLAVPNAALGGLTLNAASETHEGLLDAKELIANLEGTGFSEGLLGFAEAVHHQWRQEYDLLLDLLPAAWGMNEDEFEQILEVPPGWLRAWRNHEVGVDPKVNLRIARCRSLHNAIRMTMRPQRYANFWRRSWARSSPLGLRSPWQAYQDDGDSALAIIEAYFLAQR